jgi:hypothetical protein
MVVKVSRARPQQATVVVARAHMAVDAPAGWSHAAREAARTTARTVPNRRMTPGQALNQPRWQPARLLRSSPGLENITTAMQGRERRWEVWAKGMVPSLQS